jgi:YVTN family beta-propeller protein
VAIAITPNGRTAYVANCDDDTVTPINLATGTPRPAIKVGINPDAIAITPNGRTAYVANYDWPGNGGTVTRSAWQPASPGIPSGSEECRLRSRLRRTGARPT